MVNRVHYIARIYIEATTSMAIYSGDKSFLLDNQIARDANGMPYIPGTSLAGLILHAAASEERLVSSIKDLFGCGTRDRDQKNGKDSVNESRGSRLIFSSAHILDHTGKKVLDGLVAIDWNKEYYQKMAALPQRDHVRITEKGGADAKGHGKFDREIIYKGTRFCFEIELQGDKSHEDDWNTIVGILHRETLRIGAGTRKGSGGFKVLKKQSTVWTFDLNQPEDLKAYLHKSANLNNRVIKASTPYNWQTSELEGWEKMTIALKPLDFFYFGSGVANENADDTPKKETVIEWTEDGAIFKEKLVIPAASVKGAISHRTAFYSNLQKGIFIGCEDEPKPEEYGLNIEAFLKENLQLPDYENWTAKDDKWKVVEAEIQNLNFEELLEKSELWKQFLEKASKLKESDPSLPVGEKNHAVAQLFGTAKDAGQGRIGKVIFDDIYLDQLPTKVLNHVKIDRFTGGASKGALFQEEVLFGKDQIICLNFWIYTKDIDPESKLALDKAINDLKTGQLSLGGKTTKGHGIFIEQPINS